MRSDFAKVLVERPRRQTARAYDRGRDSTKSRRDLAAMPKHGGMRSDLTYRKSLNENLSPLKRFLERSIGRSWNSVYSELHEHIHKGNPVQAHILEHLDDYVARNVRIIDNHPHRPGRRHAWEPINAGYNKLFVHPRTGILLRVPKRPRRKKAQADDASIVKTYITRLVVLVRENGTWYHVTMTSTAAAFERYTATSGIEASRDYLTQVVVAPWTARRLASFYGRKNVYASYRGLPANKKVLKEHKLFNLLPVSDI